MKSATIPTVNRFDCLPEEPLLIVDDDLWIAECDHCNLSNEGVHQQCSILTSQKRKDVCNRQQSDEDSHNINDRKSRTREMARMRQRIRRRGKVQV